MNFAEMMQSLADKGFAHRDLVRLRQRAIALMLNKKNRVTVYGVARAYLHFVEEGKTAFDLHRITDAKLLKIAREKDEELHSGSVS